MECFSQAYLIALFFFGAQCLVMGYLFVTSKMVPRLIGYLLLAAGIGWIVLSAGTLLAPNTSSQIGAFIMPLGALAELALAIWLLVKGVRPDGDGRIVSGND